MSVEGNGQRLDAAADAQHGNLAVVGQPGDEQFGQVALAVDMPEFGRRFLAAPEGVDVGSSREDERIEAVEGIHQHVAVVHGRNDDGNAASLHHLIIIGIAQRGIHPFVVGRDTDERSRFSFGILLIDAVEMFLQIKHFGVSFMITGSHGCSVGGNRNSSLDALFE